MNKVLLITGGTGSFGTAFLKKAVANKDFTEIRIFSRDEKKQDDLRKSLNDDRLKFYIGNVRDLASVSQAVKGADYIFHLAAINGTKFFYQKPDKVLDVQNSGPVSNTTKSLEEDLLKKIK